MTALDPGSETAAELRHRIRARHPRLREAVRADALVAVRYRGEAQEFSSRLQVALAVVRLALVSDAFLAQMLYRVKARLQGLGIPVLPRIAHRLAIALSPGGHECLDVWPVRVGRPQKGDPVGVNDDPRAGVLLQP